MEPKHLRLLIPGVVVLTGCALFVDLDGLRKGDDTATPDAAPDAVVVDAAADGATTRPLFYMDIRRAADAQAQAMPMVAYPETDAAPIPIGCPSPVDLGVFTQATARGASGNPNGDSYAGPKFMPPPLALNRAFYPGASQVAPGDAVFVYNAGSASSSVVVAVDETSRCGSPIHRIDPFSDAGPTAFQFPRFRGDGQRVAYLGRRAIGSAVGLYTVAVRGAEPPRLLEESDLIASTPPAWIDGPRPKVMWVESGGTVVAREDGPATAETVTTCSGRVTQIGYLAKAPFQRVVLEIAGRLSWVEYGGDCAYRTPLVADPPAVVQQDFAISPDDQLIAYASNRGEAEAGVPHTHLWLVGSEGGTPTSCTPADPTYDDFGAQWFGTSQLVWTRVPRPGGKAPSGIMTADVVNGRCENIRSIAAASPIEGGTHLVMGSANAGCNASGGADGGTGWSVALAGALIAWRRRRARSSGRAR